MSTFWWYKSKLQDQKVSTEEKKHKQFFKLQVKQKSPDEPAFNPTPLKWWITLSVSVRCCQVRLRVALCMRAPSSSIKGEEQSETRLQDPDNLFFSVVQIWSDTFTQVHREEGNAAVQVGHWVELKRTEPLFGSFILSLYCKEFYQVRSWSIKHWLFQLRLLCCILS